MWKLVGEIMNIIWENVNYFIYYKERFVVNLEGCEWIYNFDGNDIFYLIK